ncbi:hypothetical protein HJFPF1_10534 [Paramyrothecium foliicola]|nr:hypothetical protein HJFPF1_10534 [Paramyrothecium foliicola]
MKKSNYLEQASADVLAQIVSYLGPCDLARLSFCSRRLSEQAVGRLWFDIELHDDRHHESPVELKDPPPFRSNESRPYCRDAFPGFDRAVCFFSMLLRLQENDPERAKTLCQRVRHLSAPIPGSFRRVIPPGSLRRVIPGSFRGVFSEDGWSTDEAGDPPTVWHLLPNFSNLESLELRAEGPHCDDTTLTDLQGHPPPLRFVKLFMYIPRAVVAWVLGAGSTLERLELGMLDNPDMPVSQLDTLIDKYCGYGDIGYNEAVSLHGKSVIPRPLAGFLPSSECLQSPGDLCLPRLRHLYLCQPTYSGGQYICKSDYNWCSRTDKACLCDWHQLLLASRETLETMVLEQRPAGELTEMDTMEIEDWMIDCVDCNAAAELVDMVLRFIENPGFEKLKDVYLYGMKCQKDDPRVVWETGSYYTPAVRLLRALKRRNIRGEARIGQFCIFDKNHVTSTFGTWFNGENMRLIASGGLVPAMFEQIKLFKMRRLKLWDRVIGRS